MYDCVEVVDVEAVVTFVKGLQQPDGSFIGDKWGGSSPSLSASLLPLSLFLSHPHTHRLAAQLQVKWTPVSPSVRWPA